LLEQLAYGGEYEFQDCQLASGSSG